MIHLNNKASDVFNKLIQLMDNKQHLKIDNAAGCFMPITIEQLGNPYHLASKLVINYSLSHYFKNNGDLIPDPDMVFAFCVSDNSLIYPLTLQNQLIFTEAVYLDDNGNWVQMKKAQKNLVDFANIWLKNIKYQQSL